MLLKFFILGQLFLDSGTENVAVREIIHPDYVIEGRVLEWGYADKSIPVPSGLYQGGDMRVKFADTDLRWRDVVVEEPLIRRFLQLKIVQEGTSEAAVQPFVTMEIFDAETSAGAIEIFGRDITFAWIDELIPGLINRTNFPDLMDGIDEAFMPIIFGILESVPVGSPPSPQGVLKLPRMTLTRWGVAQHPIEGVTAVYRKHVDEGEFTIFPQGSPPEWDVVEEVHVIDGLSYTLTFLDFAVDQDPGMEVRVDVHGANFRGNFGSMTAVSGIGALQDFIDCGINLLYAFLRSETRIARFDVDSFAEARTTLATLIDDSPPTGYKCDGAITRSVTKREVLAWWLTSAEMDLFVNRYGQIAVNLTTETDPARPLFSQGPVFDPDSDNSLIVINSLRQRLANPHINRLRYNYALNYYDPDEFSKKNVFDNEADQLALGGDASPPNPDIIEGTCEFRFVRDSATAAHVASRRMAFLALGSYRLEWQMPLPEVFDDLELAALVGISHRQGLSPGGYINKEVKVTGLTYDLDRLLCTVRGILRVPQEVEPEEACGSLTGSLAGLWSHNSLVGPHAGLTADEIYGVFKDPDNTSRIFVAKSEDGGEVWTRINDTFPTLTNIVASHVSKPDNTGGIIIAIQEAVTGRVSYSRLLKSTDTWDVLNEQVTASTTTTNAMVDIVDRATGVPAILYAGDVENVSGSDRLRCKLKWRTGVGTWSSEIQIGDNGLAHSNTPSRVVAGTNLRLQCFFNEDPGTFVGSTPDLCIQTVRADDSLSSVNVWLFTGLLGGTPQGFVGDPTSHLQGSDMKILIPFKWGGEFADAIFTDADNVPTTDEFPVPPSCVVAACEAIYESPFVAISAQCCFRSVAIPDEPGNFSLHAVAFGLALFSRTWLFYKEGAFGVMTPSSAFNFQCGPYVDPGPLVSQEMGADIQRFGEFYYVRSFMASGIGIAFNQVKTVNLPVYEDIEISDWIIECDHPAAPMQIAISGNDPFISLASPIVLGAQTTLVGWYYLTSAINNYNPIWGQNGTNEIYYGSGTVSGKVEIVKGGTTIFRSSSSVSANGPHFLVIVDDGSAIKAYYDNVDMGNVIGGYTSLSGMTISRLNQGENANNFNGRYDELAVFSRALSSEERTALYNSGVGVRGDVAVAPFNLGLTAMWHFDEGGGLVAGDYADNGHHGTLTDGPTWIAGHVPL